MRIQGGMVTDMGENIRYAVGTLYMGGWSDHRGGNRDHIGIIDYLYGDRMAFVRTLCGRKGKIVYTEIRSVQGVEDWFDAVGRGRLADFLCLTCKRVWEIRMSGE